MPFFRIMGEAGSKFVAGTISITYNGYYYGRQHTTGTPFQQGAIPSITFTAHMTEDGVWEIVRSFPFETTWATFTAGSTADYMVMCHFNSGTVTFVPDNRSAESRISYFIADENVNGFKYVDKDEYDSFVNEEMEKNLALLKARGETE